ncbi:hypothetical protein EMIHUDRAFT_434384 [Emiliania huxleyi CCMP1516]|uniref:K Homology domain-containing protein n=2 Tax=Emiliania huxleyi TaxID=2903 RepID=A0A0D3K5Q2_EMIH1|nr:hypothetical protein EMIHUDRAFT_434384 [Emiliania huxleyi CCMP1516]EOD31087.1 hypothetical protein EMIHUDRAFT_434384 [Emiliania huxleyi CCMP1516]|eukprot:XP_005783516.1 hypothetical protein EMIHUDRAFT_434384 [Emiliania huxleyi CCMP1516]
MSTRTETMPLSDDEVAYLVGRGGQTKFRLENFSLARLNIDKDSAELTGTDDALERARLAIKITLQQRNGGRIDIDFQDMEERKDVETLDVPVPAVGFLLGSKGATLRKMEEKHRVFMFFDNDRKRDGKHGPSKRLYIVGPDRARDSALEESEEVVNFKMGTGGGRRPAIVDNRDQGGRGGPPPRYDDRGGGRYSDDRRDYDRGRGYDERDRGVPLLRHSTPQPTPPLRHSTPLLRPSTLLPTPLRHSALPPMRAAMRAARAVGLFAALPRHRPPPPDGRGGEGRPRLRLCPMRHHHRATGAGMTTGATTTAASATATMSATGAPRGNRDDTLSAARPPCPRRRPPAPGLTRPAWAGTTTAAATTATTAAAKRRAERGARPPARTPSLCMAGAWWRERRSWRRRPRS